MHCDMRGHRIKESSFINKSLLALSHVIYKLTESTPVIRVVAFFLFFFSFVLDFRPPHTKTYHINHRSLPQRIFCIFIELTTSEQIDKIQEKKLPPPPPPKHGSTHKHTLYTCEGDKGHIPCMRTGFDGIFRAGQVNQIQRGGTHDCGALGATADAQNSKDAHTQAHKQTDTRTNTTKRKYIQKDRQTDKWMDRQTDRQTNTKVGKQTQADRPTHQKHKTSERMDRHSPLQSNLSTKHTTSHTLWLLPVRLRWPRWLYFQSRCEILCAIGCDAKVVDV